jgi:hypothetical protein
MRSEYRTFCCVLSLVAILLTSPQMVLCIGEDGHVAIEPYGHCHDGPAHRHTTAVSDDSPSHVVPGPDAEGCSPCTDIPLSTDIRTSQTGRKDARLLTNRAIGPVTTLWDPPAGFARRSVPSYWELSVSYHTPLSSIVLRL